MSQPMGIADSLKTIFAQVQDMGEDMERENIRLQNMIDSLTEQLENNPPISSELHRLLDAVGAMTRAYRGKYDILPDVLQQIIDAYDKCERAKGEGA